MVTPLRLIDAYTEIILIDNRKVSLCYSQLLTITRKQRKIQFQQGGSDEPTAIINMLSETPVQNYAVFIL